MNATLRNKIKSNLHTTVVEGADSEMGGLIFGFVGGLIF